MFYKIVVSGRNPFIDILGYETATVYALIMLNLSFWEKVLAISRCGEIARIP